MNNKAMTNVNLAKWSKHLKVIPGNAYAIALLVVVFGIMCNPKTFLTVGNAMNILEQCTILAIVVVGSFLAMVTRGIDLSLGATMSFAGVVVAQLVKLYEMPMVVAAILAVLAGGLMGALNGIIISRSKAAPFIITLGTMNIARSLALILSENRTVSVNLPEFRFIGGAYLFNFIPYSIFVVIVVYIIFSMLTSATRLGTYWYSIGGNETSAALSGINVKFAKLLAYTFGGMLAAVAGVVLASRLGSANPGQGDGYEFYGIAAAVVGGTSMSGGKGSVLRSLTGVIVICTLRNGLNMAGLPTSLQMVALGMVIIGVVAMDAMKGGANK